MGVPTKPPRERRQSTVANVVREYHIWRVVRHIVLVGLLIGYAFIGAAIFYWLERPEEQRLSILRANETLIRQEKLVQDLFDIHESCNGYEGCWTELELVVRLYEEKLGLNTSNTKYKWDFWNSLFYAGTIFTTIGYGHMYCQTRLGQLATMLYALIGIPLVMTVLNYMGKTLFRHARRNWNRLLRFLNFLCCKMRGRGKTLQITRENSVSTTTYEEGEANFPLTLALLIMVGYTFLCAYLFSFWETQWDYFTVFYYFFITLSTIGLGDLVPEHPRYTLFGFIFVIIGLSLVTMCINIMQAQVEDRYAKALKDLEERWELTSEFGMSMAGDPTSPGGNEPSPYPRSPFREHPDVDQDEFFGGSLGILKLHKRIDSNYYHPRMGSNSKRNSRLSAMMAYGGSPGGINRSSSMSNYSMGPGGGSGYNRSPGGQAVNFRSPSSSQYDNLQRPSSRSPIPAQRNSDVPLPLPKTAVIPSTPEATAESPHLKPPLDTMKLTLTPVSEISSSPARNVTFSEIPESPVAESEDLDDDDEIIFGGKATSLNKNPNPKVAPKYSQRVSGQLTHIEV